MTGYSASKAAAHSLTQALRPVLAARGITVRGVYPAGIDTDMLAGIDAPKTAPDEVATAILDGLAADHEDIFPDPNARSMAQLWWTDPKGVERAFSGRRGRRFVSPQLPAFALPGGLTSQEVARVLADTTTPVDRLGTEEALTRLAARGAARRTAVADDALWTAT